MNLKTKYDLNQIVWFIMQKNKTEFVECKACEGTGIVILKDDNPRACPECFGRKGNTILLDLEWFVERSLTIGEIQTTITNLEKTGDFDNFGIYKEGENKQENKYMCYETGIGSGSLYYEKDLFPSIKEAQKECDKRNLTGGKS